MRKIFAMAALCIAFLAAPAAASDHGAKSSFTGCYVGAHAGVTSQSVDVGAGGSDFLTLGLDGTFVGGQAGCDAQLGKLVVGGFGEFNFYQADEDNSFIVPLNLEIDRKWSVGGRAGLLINDQTLLYGKLAWTKASGENNDLTGWDLGGGLEIADVFGTNLALQLDYTFTKWNDEDNAFGFPGVESDATQHSARS
jgi:opacity protein-like surface antigen